MQNHQTKFGRALSILMSVVMALSVVLVNPVDVQAASKAVKNVKVSSKEVTIAKGATQTVTATVKLNKKLAMKDKYFRVVATPADTSVVSVSVKKPTGKKKAKTAKSTLTITGLKAGTTTITVAAKKKKSKKQVITVKVEDNTPAPTVAPTVAPTLAPTVAPTATPTAEPTAEPTATPTAEPTATPTAEPTATPTVEPTAAPTTAPTPTPSTKPTAENTEIELPEDVSATDPAVEVGSSVQLKTNQDGLTWKSSNDEVATINSDGTVTGVKDGKVSIQLVDEDGNVIKSVEFKVGTGVVKLEKITLEIEPASILVGETAKAKVSPVPADADLPDVTLTSDAEDIASVSNNGIVSGNSVGKATITAKTADGKEAYAEISVNKKQDPVKGVKLSSNEETLQIGQNAALIATVDPVDSSDVTWSTSDDKVATVDGGKVTAIGTGTATITVTTVTGGYQATCTVYVVAVGTKDLNITDSVAMSAEVGGYKNVVMTGSTADTTLSVTDKKGQPVPGVGIQLSVKEGTGNVGRTESLKAVINDNTITVNSVDNAVIGTVTTDKNGQAKFSLYLTKADGSALKPTDGVMQSYVVSASASSSTTSAVDNFNISFAQLRIPDVDVSYLDGAVPSANAYPGDNGYFTTSVSYKKDSNDDEHIIGVDYVTSQQVENPVFFDCVPVVMIPKSASDSTNDEVHITQKLKYVTEKNEDGEYVKVLKPIYTEEEEAAHAGEAYKSGAYSVYNDSSIDGEKTIIVELPAGLKDASFNFTKYQISQYTRMKINFVWAEDGTQVYYEDLQGGIGEPVTVVRDKSNLSKDSIQIEKLDEVNSYGHMDQRMLAYICIESEGQVNSSENGGYEFLDVLGHFQEGFTGGWDVVRLYDSVTWEKEDITYESSANEITPENIEEYIKPREIEDDMDDSEIKRITRDKNFVQNVKKGLYNLQLSVPTFTYSSGDAILTAVHKNDATEVVYYVYPTERNANNKNVCADPHKNEQMCERSGDDMDYDGFGDVHDEKKAAISVSRKAATTREVGELYVDELTKILTVDSKDAGSTGVKLTLESPLFCNIFGGTNKEVIHTSVQWEAKANDAEVIIPDKYYLLRGQKAVIGAYLEDKHHNPVEKGSIKLTGIPNTGADIEQTKTTDKNGLVTFELTDTNVTAGAIYNVNNIILEETTDQEHILSYWIETADGKRIDLDTEKPFDLYWVTAGIYFKDKVVGGTPVIEYKKNDNEAFTLSREVGQNWTTGFQIVGGVNDSCGYYVSDIDGLHLGFTDGKNVDLTADADNENAVTFTQTKIGITSIKTFFQDVDENELTFVFTLEDLEDPTKVIYEKSVGQGTPSLPAKMVLNLDWTAATSGYKFDILTPQGSSYQLGAGENDRKIYVIAKDQYDNMVNGTVYYSVNGSAYNLSAQEYEVQDAELTITNGYGEIKLPEFTNQSGGSVNVEVRLVQDGAVKAKKAMSVYVPAEVNEFAIVGARLTETEKTIDVEFSQNLDVGVVNAGVLANLFKVEGIGTNENKEYTISSAKLADTNLVRIVLREEPAESKIKITAQKYPDAKMNITYALSGETGGKLENDASITFEKNSNVYLLKAYADVDGQRLIVRITKGDTIITGETLGDYPIFIVDTGSEKFIADRLEKLDADDYDDQVKGFVLDNNAVKLDSKAKIYYQSAHSSGTALTDWSTVNND